MTPSSDHTGRLVGYARVSTKPNRGGRRQHVDNQVQRLYAEGCEVVFTDEVTGKDASRPAWDKCRAYLRAGDVLVFTKLDRVGRSLPNLVEVVDDLGRRGVNLRSLDQGAIDTTTASGKLLFQVMGAVAEFEADICRERTLEGVEAARKRHGGTLPKRGLGQKVKDKLDGAEVLLRSGMPAAEVAKTVGISRASMYRHVVPRVRADAGESAVAS